MANSGVHVTKSCTMSSASYYNYFASFTDWSIIFWFVLEPWGVCVCELLMLIWWMRMAVAKARAPGISHICIIIRINTLLCVMFTWTRVACSYGIYICSLFSFKHSFEKEIETKMCKRKFMEGKFCSQKVQKNERRKTQFAYRMLVAVVRKLLGSQTLFLVVCVIVEPKSHLWSSKWHRIIEFLLMPWFCFVVCLSFDVFGEILMHGY